MFHVKLICSQYHWLLNKLNLRMAVQHVWSKHMRTSHDFIAMIPCELQEETHLSTHECVSNNWSGDTQQFLEIIVCF